MQINSQQTYSFAGINKALTRHYVSTNQTIRKIQELYPNNYYAKNIVGSVPPAWFSNIKPENREQFVKDIYDVFADYTTNARYEGAFLIDEMRECMKGDLQYLGLNVVDIGKIPSKGSYGRVYTIDILEDNKIKKYALKIFFEQASGSRHGNYSEPRFAAFIPKILNDKHSNIKKMYFADLDAGYIFTEYITDAQKPATPILPQLYGFTHADDHKDNILNGHIIDYGGFVQTNELLENKDARNKAMHLASIEADLRGVFWHKEFAKIEESLKKKPDVETQNKALALAATIPLLDSKSGKLALALMLNRIKEMDKNIKERVAITISSIMPTLEKNPEYDVMSEFVYKTLIDLKQQKIKDNIRLSVIGYHYLSKYDKWF